MLRRRLEAVDFNVGLAELRKYKAANGDLMVSQGTVVDVDGVELKLGRWSRPRITPTILAMCNFLLSLMLGFNALDSFIKTRELMLET